MQYSHSITASNEFEYKLLAKKHFYNSAKKDLKRKRNLLVFSIIYGIVLGSLIFMLVNA